MHRRLKIFDMTQLEIMTCFGVQIPSKENLGLEILERGVIGDDVNNLLQRTLKHFYSSEWVESYKLSDMLIDYTWEQLNTGHWKDVHISWRYVYSYASLLKAVSHSKVETDKHGEMADRFAEEVILICDMGLVMGAPICNNLLRTLASACHKDASLKNPSSETDEAVSSKRAKLDPHIQPDRRIPVSMCPSLEYFKTNYMDLNEPVVLKDVIGYWPALNERKWTVEYIKHVAGKRTVPIEIGSKYTDSDWTQKLLTIDQFIDRYILQEKGDKAYLAQHQLFDQIPELQRDISVPSYCAITRDTHDTEDMDDETEAPDDTEDVDINAWFGPCGTVSPLHQDPKHNLLAQVVGRKYVRLYSTKYTDYLYPHMEGIVTNTSQVDVEHVDADAFPLFSQAVHQDYVLEPGDLLYIPPKHWHYLRSLSMSFSVSFWWK